MNISERLRASESTTATRVVSVCSFVQELEDSGEYPKAISAMGEWWQGIGVRPLVDTLKANQKAAVLSRVGTLSSWLGSMRQVPESQGRAKDLISEAADLYQAIGDQQNWAETRSDLAICYWREGSFDEARVILQDVLDSDVEFSAELKGKIILRLITVEISAKHFETASVHLDQVASLIENKGNPLLIGKFYFYRAFTLRSRGEDQNKNDLLRSAIDDYHTAGLYYKKARHEIFAANVENNLGNTYRLLNNYRKAHSHLDKAIYLFIKLKDQANAALAYENKAQAFLAENRFANAEAAARASVEMVSAGDEKSILSESLTTLAIVLSRGGELKEAMSTFEEAKNTALSVGDTESAGNALLNYIEELQPYLTPIVIRKLYLEADDLLKNSPKIGTINRLQKIARKQLEIDNTEALFKSEKVFSWRNFSLPEAIRTYEGEIILKALTDAGGRVTKAARLLGMPHQSLSIILHNRHKELKEYCVQRKPRGSLKAKKAH